VIGRRSDMVALRACGVQVDSETCLGHEVAQNNFGCRGAANVPHANEQDAQSRLWSVHCGV